MEPNDQADLRILPFPTGDRGNVILPAEEDWDPQLTESEWDDLPLPEGTSPRTDGDEGPDLKEALLAGQVVRGLGGTDRDGVLRELVEVLPLPATVCRADAFRTLAGGPERETLVVGDGIALPHPDAPLLVPGARPSVTICFLDRPVDFGGAGGQLVHTVIGLVAPSALAHRRLLDRLTIALHGTE